ncbi:MAG TPA: FAD-dependent oxidoreductase [Phycisphaerae bacterium]|nr:FAD-dependent oxidoreductase [Phycisphaerae bacterium]
MKSLTIPSKKVPLDDSWDVLVAGGGPAGCAAATAAARQGAKTLLIESTGGLGGMGTQGLVTTWAPFSDKKGTILYGGLAKRLLQATKEAMPHIPADKLDWVLFNPEQLKRVYDAMVRDAGATILFNVLATGVEVGGKGEVSAVLTAGKGGLKAYSAKVYVDCTGDGDIAAWGGATFEKGDPATGVMQPASLCFLLANVNTEAYLKGRKLHPAHAESPMYDILKSGRYPLIKDAHCCNGLLGPSVVSFNAGHVWDVDGTDPASVSAGLIEGRKIAEQFRLALAEFAPEAFGQAVLVAVAPSLGIRETRRIVGDYTLSIDDYLARRTFDDEISRNNYWIDVHSARHEATTVYGQRSKEPSRFERYGPGESHGIPYRCLTPKGLRNVLVAGRCISCDRPVQGTIRVMPACVTTGEAAGLAAGLAAASKDRNVHDVDVRELRRLLKQHDAYLPD